VDVDLIDAHLDPFDHGCEHSARARRRQLGPLLPDPAARATSRCWVDGSGICAEIAL
jgi:hypothetical protein